MTGDRIAVARLVGDPDHGGFGVDGPVDRAEYARFKHGDGRIALQYGTALAEVFAATLPDDAVRVKVTSSAFGFVPPAAHSLVAPFVARLRQITDLHLECFKVDRLTVTNGDYATMPTEQRKLALGAGSLLVDPQTSLLGQHVVSVDDVRVTGTHEAVMDQALTAAGAERVQHLYVIDAWAERENPETESVMNASSVRTVADLIDIAGRPWFIPNARFCKRVVTLGAGDLTAFLAAAPAAVTEWVATAVELDALHQYAAYASGCAAFTLARSQVARTAAAHASACSPVAPAGVATPRITYLPPVWT